MCINTYRLNDTYVQRTFVVKQEGSMEQLEVQQFQILAWPEGDNPPSLSGLLEVLEDPEVQQPLLVHSRTGIGRTGVIICVHYALKCINTGRKLDLPGLVRRMRQQRGGMIQNFEQYKTCILAILRYLQHVTGFTSMRIEDGASSSASLPQLDIIHPRTHTVAAHPLVTHVAKQVSRTYSDPTLNGSPQTKRRMYLQDMIPPPPTQPPPYTDDDAARAPTSPQVPVSPPPPLTPPDNDNFKSTTTSPQTSSVSPMQFKTDSTTISTTTVSPTTTTTSRTRRPSIVLDDGENTEVLLEPDSDLLQRQTMRASQHNVTVIKLDDQLQQEATEKPQFPPQKTEENNLFTTTSASTTSLTSTTTTTTTTTTSTTKEINSTVGKPQPVVETAKSTTKSTPDTEDGHGHQHPRQETTPEVPSMKPDPIVETHKDEDAVKQVVTDPPPVTQTTVFDHQQVPGTPKSVRETAKMFGGIKSQTKLFSHTSKVKSSIGERAKLFGGSVTASPDQSKSSSHTSNEQKSSVSEITKRFGSTKSHTVSTPPKPPLQTMENQTLTFTFDKVDGEFTEMKLSRSVEKLDEPEDQTFTAKSDVPPSTSFEQKASNTPEFRRPPKQSEPRQQPPQQAIKKLDMSKFAMFGKSVHN